MKSGDTGLKRDGGSCLHWRKPGSVHRETSKGWCVSLDLVINGGHDHASLVIYRHYNSRALQLDVNMLTAEFPDALAEALDRARARPWRNAIGPSADETESIAESVAEAS